MPNKISPELHDFDESSVRLRDDKKGGTFHDLEHVPSLDEGFTSKHEDLWDQAVENERKKSINAVKNNPKEQESGRSIPNLVRGFSLYDSEEDEDLDHSTNRVAVYNTPYVNCDDEDSEDSEDEDSDEEEDEAYASKSSLSSKSAALIQQQLKSFVPNIITVLPEAKHLANIHFEGYFLLADISGFTKLSSKLCAQGSKGLDKLRGITNSSFRSFIDIILVHGGDVIAFAGDALICIFRPPTTENKEAKAKCNSNGRKSLRSKKSSKSIGKSSSNVSLTSKSFKSSKKFNRKDDKKEKKKDDEKAKETTLLTPTCTENTHINTEKDKEYIAHCGLACIACAKEICATKLNGVQIHCGVTYGNMSAAILGGYKKKYAVILNGKCTEEIGQVLDSAGPNEVVISKVVYRLINQHLNDGDIDAIINNDPCSAILSHDYTEDECKDTMATTSTNTTTATTITQRQDICNDQYVQSLISLDGKAILYKILVTPAFVAEKAGISQKMQTLGKKETRKHDKPSQRAADSSQYMQPLSHSNSDTTPLHNNSIETISSFLTKPVVAATYSNDIEDLAEIRTVTTMFLNLNSYSGEKFHDLSQLQPFFLAMQKCLHSTGGLLRQFLIDDKGCVLIALWGVPSASYPCNATRAITCGVLMRQAAKDVEQDISIGITTGSVYCGTVGSPLRREYVAIGRTVNLAARLMGQAKGRVLVDIVTYNKLSANVTKSMQEIEPLTLKGIAKPVVCYEYNGNIAPPSEHDHLDAGAIVIPKYLRKCITDIFDSHRFLNGSMVGLQVMQRAKSKADGGGADNESSVRIGSFKYNNYTASLSDPQAIAAAVSQRGGDVDGKGDVNGDDDHAKKKSNERRVRRSSEATSFLTNQRAYQMIGSHTTDTTTKTGTGRSATERSGGIGNSNPSNRKGTDINGSGDYDIPSPYGSNTDPKRQVPNEGSSKSNIMDFEPNWSGFFVVKGGSGSGKTTIASHIIRQYEITRQLQIKAISSDNATEISPYRQESSDSNTSNVSNTSGCGGSNQRRPHHFNLGRKSLLEKLQLSKDIHNFVPFVAIQKADSEGLLAVRKIFKSMLSHTGCLATVDEEKEEILHLLQTTYPYHTKTEIMTLIFPFIRKLLKLQWYISVENDEFVAFTSFNGENHRNDMKLLAYASEESTLIHKNKNGSFITDNNTSGESNETIVLSDLLRTLLRNNVAILVIDDAHNMSSDSWKILITLAKQPHHMDALIILTLLTKETLQNDKEYKTDRAGLKVFSETKQELTMLEMAHTAGRSMAKGLLDLESELDFCQDKYDELCSCCMFSTVGSTASRKSSFAPPVSSAPVSLTRPGGGEGGGFGEELITTKKNYLHELKVEPLVQRSVMELIKVTLALDQPITDETLTIVMDITHGNPSMLWKIIRYFNDSDYTDFDQAIGQLCDNSLIVSLIEGFTNVQKNVLKYCAAIGEEFSFQVLLSVFPKNEKNLTRAQLYDVLTDLISSGLIVRISNNYYSFKSSLIRKFMYALIPPSVAALMHNEIAAHIQHRYSNDSNVYSSLSYHYTNSSNSGTNALQAFRFSLKTAEKYLEELRLLEIMPFLQICCDYVKCRDERNAVLKVIESCMTHIKRVIDTKKAIKPTNTKKGKVSSKSMDVEVLIEVLNQLKKLKTRLKTRFKSTQEKIISSLLCFAEGGCCNLDHIQRKRKKIRASKSKLYHMSANKKA